MARGAAVEPALRDAARRGRRSAPNASASQSRHDAVERQPAARADDEHERDERARRPSTPRRRRARCRARRPPTARPSRGCGARARRRARAAPRPGAGPRRGHAGPTATSVIPRFDDPHRVREERRELARAERVEHVVEAARAEAAGRGAGRAAASARTAAACAGRAGTSGSASSRTRAARRGRARATNCRWPSRPPATCSTTAFEKPTSNSPSANGSSRPSARTARHERERGGEAVELGVPDGGDPLRPRVERLEEVVASSRRRTARR